MRRRKSMAEVAAPTTRLIALPLPGRSSETQLELATPQGDVTRISSQTQVDWLGGVLEPLR
jgi:hypothetical protein